MVLGKKIQCPLPSGSRRAIKGIPRRLPTRLLHQRFHCLKSVSDPTEQATRRVLSERVSGFTGLDRCVAVVNETGRNEQGSTARALENQAKLFHIKVTTSSMIKQPSAANSAHPMDEVQKVDMVEGDSIRAAIEGSRGKDRIIEDVN